MGLCDRLQAAAPKTTYEQTEHDALTRDFLMTRDRYLRRLLGDGNKTWWK